MTRSTATPVLHVLGRLEHGGSEHRLIELMRHFSGSEFRLDVCALSGLPGVLDSTVEALGGKVIHLGLDATFPARFVRWLRFERYRAVHSHVMHMSGPILALAAYAGVPIRIAHYRSTDDGGGWTRRRVARRAIMRHFVRRYATDVLAVAEGVMDAVWGSNWHDDPRCRVVYDAVDPNRLALAGHRDDIRRELGIPPVHPLFLHVGRWDVTKNYPRLLAIFSEICRNERHPHLVLVGAGTDDPDGEMAAQIRKLGIEARVRRLGPRTDVPRLLRAADVLLLPSLWEGLPGVVLEACAAGVPVLATDLPGVREIASRLPLVRYLPLTAADADWARAALDLPLEAERIGLRGRAFDAFQSSVFDIQAAVKAHRDLWGRPRQERPSAATAWSRCAR